MEGKFHIQHLSCRFEGDRVNWSTFSIQSYFYTRFAFRGLVVERRIINLEFHRLPKDQRTVHIALAQRKKW